jgi:hypothetical protein
MNSFNLYLSSDLGKGFSLNFETKLNDSRINQDNYEVAVSQISFSNTEKLDLGKIVFCSYLKGPEGPPKNTELSIFAHMGESFSNVFERINSEIAKIYKKNEFARRVYLRSKNYITEREIYYDDSKSGIANAIVLPFLNDDSLNKIVDEQIDFLCPNMTLQYYKDVNKDKKYVLLHNLKSLNHTISYTGNITSIIEGLKDKLFNEISGGPQHVILESEFLQDMKLLFIETDIIENGKYCNNDMQILKLFETKTQSTPQLIDFSDCMEYRQLKYKEVNERLAIENEKRKETINISFKDRNFKNLNFSQGNILVKLHFRKRKYEQNSTS